MTKRVNWLPNERVDIPDLTDGTTTLVTGMSKQTFDQTILNNFAAIMSGFRVEIADQVLNPGQFTIYNGISFDRSGQLIYNEEEENAQRSFTLIADGQYFVEVEFALNETNSDARGFWDPTVSNGNDPSGDTRMPGREFPQTVATRLTPDWQIVLPISGTDFQINTNPNSIRIPIAALQRVAGVIAGFTSFSAKTCLAAHYVALSSTQIKVLDSRIFPDTFTATVGATAVTVSANDRVNNILTLSAVLVADHAVGERIAITTVGAAQFLAEATPLTLPTVGSLDARPRYWQGNEERGYALVQDPYTATGRSDVSLQTLKDEVDFLTSQLREMRFGAERAADLGKSAPPATFATPRYFDKSGGVQGARCNSVSIGDGTTSWGDFNVTAFASAQATFAAAIAALPAAGGTIFVKRSATPYLFTTGIIFGIGAKPTHFIGENNSVEIKATAAAAAFSLSFGKFSFRNIRITRDAAATATAALSVSTGGELYMQNCYVEGLRAAAALATSGQFDSCSFTSSAGGGTSGNAVEANFRNASFSNCQFTTAVNAAGSRCMVIAPIAGEIESLTFQNCVFTGLSAMTYIAELNTTGGTSNTVKFDMCKFIGTGAADAKTGIGSLGLSTQNLTITECSTSTLGTFAFCSNFTGITNIVDCVITNTNVGIEGSLVSNVNIVRCKFAQTGTTLGRYGVFLGDGSGYSTVSECDFIGLNDISAGRISAVSIGSNCAYITVENNRFTGIGNSLASTVSVSAVSVVPGGANPSNFININDNIIDGVFATSPAIADGILVTNTCKGISISGNSISSISSFGLATCNGVRVVTIFPGAADINISNNRISFLGHAGGSAASGINCSGTSLTNINCSNNLIEGLTALAATSGIFFLSQIDGLTISSNQIFAQTSAAAIGVFVGSPGVTFTRRVAVVGNVINSYLQGINITGAAAATNIGVVVSGNVLNTNTAASIGILTKNLKDVTVAGNSVHNDSAIVVQFKQNIRVDTCSFVAVTGNSLRRTGSNDAPGAVTTDSANMVIFTSDQVMISGNKILDDATAANWRGFVAHTSNFVYVAANMITKIVGGAAGMGIDTVASPIFATITYDSVLGYPNAPAAVGSTGLNWFDAV